MTVKFSLMYQAFYDDKYPVIPSDAIEINDFDHLRLISGMNNGERRVYLGKDNQLILSDPKPSQWHEWDVMKSQWFFSDTANNEMTIAQAQIAEHEKSRRVQEANNFINSQQWPGRAVMGRLNDSDKKLYNIWLDYLDELYAVDTSDPEFSWPNQPS